MGFRVHSLGFGAQGFGFRVFGVQGSSFRFRVQGLGFAF